MTLDKTFDPQKIEKKFYDHWEKSGAFACDPASDKKPHTIMMPPPNVTGSLHMGHALNTTLQDILTRYNRMKGRDALWQPGLDHAGIATQMVVERQLDEQGTSRHDLGREKFLNRVWDWKAESGGMIIGQMKALGATPDWARERFTMDEGLSKAVLKTFVSLYNDGLIYKDKRLVNWDPKLHTAISDLEVEQKEQKGKMWHISYPVEGDTAESITVATTRPETMLGDTAVAVHPADDRYRDLVGKNVVLPITGRIIPIIADDYSDPEKGSGAVKITPAHDFNDFEVGKRHDLPMINVFDTLACIEKLESIPDKYHGLDRFEARKEILRELEDLDALVEVEDIQNTVPYGDRSGVIIEPFLTDQWYVDTPTLAKEAIAAVKDGRTTFHPKQYENMYFQWLENQIPWCISRQLWWGHQIPAWYGPDGHIFVAESEEEAYKQAQEYYNSQNNPPSLEGGGKGGGVESGYSDHPHKHINPHPNPPPQGGGDEFDFTLTRDEDVLDTWFSSALWPFSTLGWPDKTPELDKYFPGDVLLTGFDIITFWVSRMMMMSLHLTGEVPFRDVYIHALVRDAKGQKMSKSKGNIVDPLDLIGKYGADALRFTLTAMAAQGRDIKLSEDRVEGYRNFATKLWNAARYCEMNNCTPDAGFDPAGAAYTPNKWILSALSRTKNVMEQAIEGYKFNEAAMAIYQFTWNTFCDWYLEFTKPLLQGDSAHTAEIRQTTAYVLDQILVLLNPIMPFITEELYEAKGDRAAMLIQTPWPEYGFEPDGQAISEMSWLTDLISEIRSVRADMNVPANAEIDLLVKDAVANTQERLQIYQDIIQRMARIANIETVSDIPKGSVQAVVGEATIGLPIADIIDLDAERVRLQKQIEKLESDINKLSQQLDNKRFIDNAPEEVVAEKRQQKSEAEATREKLSQALEQLQAA